MPVVAEVVVMARSIHLNQPCQTRRPNDPRVRHCIPCNGVLGKDVGT